jgi:hypothetical protein
MKITILDDYFDILRNLPCFGRLDSPAFRQDDGSVV